MTLFRNYKYKEVPALADEALDLLGDEPRIGTEDCPLTPAEITVAKKYAQIQFFKGKALFHNGQRGDGEPSFRLATIHDEAFPEAFAGLGMALYDLGCRRVIAVRPLLDASKAAAKRKKKDYDEYLKNCGPKPDPDIESRFQEEIEELTAIFDEHATEHNNAQKQKAEGEVATRHAIELRGATVRI